MIVIEINRAAFLQQIGAHLKTATGPQELTYQDGHLGVIAPNGEAYIEAQCTTAFSTKIAKGNLLKIITYNKRTKTLKESITLEIDPEKKRLKSPEISVNTGETLVL